MSDDDDFDKRLARLEALARMVADGDEIDWDTELSAGDDDERRGIEQLCHLSQIALVDRQTQKPVSGVDTEKAFIVWGGYDLQLFVGKGAWGDVYHAWDRKLQRDVAVKIVRESPARVLEEARKLAQVSHRNIVAVYDVSVVDERAGMVMEWIAGQTLAELVRRDGALGAREAVALLVPMLDGLAAVHRAAMVHRDVKAQNVMRTNDGRVVLMDFGIAWQRAPRETVPLAGTPAYMAPEMLDGAPPSIASDVYACGVLGYYIVSTRFPIVGNNLDEVRAAHAEGRKRPLGEIRPDLPPRFLAAIDSALATDPAARPKSASALRQLLEASIATRWDEWLRRLWPRTDEPESGG